MWYKQHLRQVRRARRRVKAQQQQLLAIELAGVVALSLHTATGTLMLPIATPAVMAALADALREALRERRQQLKAEARQLRQDWRESRQLRRQDRALVQAAKQAKRSGGATSAPGEAPR